MTRIGIVTGLAFEARALERAARRTSVADRVRIHCAGPGPARARAAAEHLLAQGTGLLLSAGLAGGLDPALAPGDALLAEAVIAPDGARYDADAARLDMTMRVLGDVEGVRRGVLLGSGTPVTSPVEKARLYRDTGAHAVDMESHAVAAVAAAAAVPFLALRVLADPAHQAIPAAALAGMRADGRVDPWPVMRAMLGRPAMCAGMLRLSRQSRVARRRLGCLGERLLARLVGPGL
ncbi:MAG: hypothetical protein ACE5ED_00185 [Rhodothalassiaceae bacterium]